MADYIYVDNSNLFIEGRRVSAVKQGKAKNIIEAMKFGVLDNSYDISFGRLYEFLTGEKGRSKNVAKAFLFGSRPPPSDSIWSHAKQVGFDVVLEDRNINNKEKKIDTGLTAKVIKHAYKHMDPKNDLAIIVAGDGDFVPAIKELHEDNFKIEVVFWKHASRELKALCDRFTDLDDHLEFLRLGNPGIEK